MSMSSLFVRSFRSASNRFSRSFSTSSIRSVYAGECDFKAATQNKENWGVSNAVLYDKNDLVLRLVARAHFVRDTFHGESLSTLLLLASLLKINAVPFIALSDCLPLVSAIKGGNISELYSDILVRIHELLRYCNLEAAEALDYLPRDYNGPSDHLGQFVKSYGKKTNYILKTWSNLLVQFSHGQGTSRTFSTISSKPELWDAGGRMEGLTWIPVEKLAVERSLEPPEHYGKAWNVLEPDYRRLFPGLDFEHWLIFFKPSVANKGEKPQNLLHTFVKLISSAFGSEEEARLKIYSMTFERFYGVGCRIDQKMAESLEALPGVIYALPDFEMVTGDYGGIKVVDGVIVKRPLEEQMRIDEAERNPASSKGETLRRKTKEEWDEINERKGKKKEEK